MKAILSTTLVLCFALNLSPVFAAEEAGDQQAKQNKIIADHPLFNYLSRMPELADIQISQKNWEKANQILSLGLAVLNGRMTGDVPAGAESKLRQTALEDQLTALLDRYGPQLVEAINEILVIAREEIARQDWTAANEWLKWGLALLGELYDSEDVPTEKAFMDNTGANLIRASSMENEQQAALLREAALSERLTRFRQQFQKADNSQAANAQ